MPRRTARRQRASRPAESSLDFVEDKDRTVFVAPFAQHAQERSRCRNKSPFTRHGFDDHRGHIRFADVGVRDFLEELERLATQTTRQRARKFSRTQRRFAAYTRPAIKIGKRRTIDFRRKRTESAFVGIRFSRQRHGHVSAAMEGVLETDHRLALGVSTRELDRVLHGFGARVGEKCFLRKIPRCTFVQPLGHCDVTLIGDHIDARVEKLVRLRFGRGDDRWLAMPEIGHPDPAGKIEKSVPVDIGDGRSACLRRHDGRSMERTRRDMFRTIGKNRLAPRSRHRRFEADRRHDELL